jgi:CII-binding regulator of phage lambda lysogenization HflD
MQNSLSNLSTDVLKKLLRLIHQNKVEFPLDAVRIACIGFQQHHDELMHSLRGLDSVASKRIVSAILIERKQQEDSIHKLQTQIQQLHQQLREAEIEIDRLENK